MEDILKELADRRRRDEAARKISEIDSKVSKCDEVRSSLQSSKTSLDNKISDWERTKNKLDGNPKCTKVVTPNIFEGEMAERLGEYMTDTAGDIKSGISNADSLSEEVQTQLNGLDTYRSNLMAERARWASQLY